MARKPVRARWLETLALLYGEPDSADVDAAGGRWEWQEGEIGVLISHRTHVWEVLAFCPRRSVTVRALVKLTDAEVGLAVTLAGLLEAPEAVAT